MRKSEAVRERQKEKVQVCARKFGDGIDALLLIFVAELSHYLWSFCTIK